MHISENQFRDLLTRYLEGKASAEEIKLLDDFFQTYKDEADLHTETLDPKIKNEILAGIKERVRFSSPRTSIIPTALKVAASLLLIVSLTYLLISKNFFEKQVPQGKVNNATDSAPFGQKLRLELSDGSKVILNAGSVITYPKQFSAPSREISLTGEAYFDVQPDRKPFIIHSGKVSTRVLGTSFNVNAAEPGKISVTLVEGSVMISRSDGDSALLKPNQQAVVADNQGIVIRNVDVYRYISWKDNTIYFEETTLKEAVEVLERWYNADINVTNKKLLGCKITGQYRNESLENVLKSFQFLLKVDYSIGEDRRIKISGEGCK